MQLCIGGCWSEKWKHLFLNWKICLSKAWKSFIIPKFSSMLFLIKFFYNLSTKLHCFRIFLNFLTMQTQSVLRLFRSMIRICFRKYFRVFVLLQMHSLPITDYLRCWRNYRSNRLLIGKEDLFPILLIPKGKFS